MTQGRAQQPNDTAILAELDRALVSKAFSRSARARNLLQYLVEAVQANKASQLKETVIALDVFGRNASTYDPSRDGIVRVSIKRLRQVLDTYYADEGRNSAFRFDIQRGGYAPIIRRVVPDALPLAPRIAVLPLANFTGDSALGGICDGLSEDLIDALAQIPRVKIIARTSSFRYRDAARDIRTIAKELDVDALVEGSVQLVDEQLRITAQLILGSDGTHLWSHAFESGTNDRGVLQAALVEAITRSLNQHDASTEHITASIEGERASAAAHEMVHRARTHRALQTPEALRMAESLSLEATKLDPNFVAAWESLASTRFAQRASWLSSDMVTVEHFRGPLRQALEIAPNHADSISLSGYDLCVHDSNWSEGIKRCRRALSLAPSNAAVLQRLGSLLLATGQTLEADQCFNKTIELDPYSPVNYYWSSFAQELLLGADAAAEKINLGRIKVGNPIIFDFVEVGHKIGAHRFSEMLPIVETAAKAQPNLPGITLRVCQCLAGIGRLEEARARFLPFLPICNPAQIDYLQMAIEGCGTDFDRFFAFANRAIDAKCPNCVLLPIDPLFVRQRAEERWANLMKRLNRSPDFPYTPLR